MGMETGYEVCFILVKSGNPLARDKWKTEESVLSSNKWSFRDLSFFLMMANGWAP